MKSPRKKTFGVNWKCNAVRAVTKPMAEEVWIKLSCTCETITILLTLRRVQVEEPPSFRKCARKTKMLPLLLQHARFISPFLPSLPVAKLSLDSTPTNIVYMDGPLRLALKSSQPLLGIIYVASSTDYNIASQSECPPRESL